ncbi:MAG: NDP-sugar synthase [Desulfobacterales bacterium]|nr:NDP-sugar synthase [Desulfobacterales bacterium]
MQAMIPAAGLGTRLRPYTLLRPKPLLPILGIPLLDLTIGALRRAGAATILVNAHHLKEQIRAAVTGRAGIVLQEEEKILGIGGGLRLALARLGPEPLLVVNGDIYHDLDLGDIYRRHCQSGAEVTMVLHDFPRFNSVLVRQGNVHGFARPDTGVAGNMRRLAFTGIHVLNPELLRPIPATGFADIIDRYRDILKSGTTIRAEVVSGHFWTDIGTIPDYLALNRGLLKGNIPACAELAGIVAQGPLHCAPGVDLGPGVRLRNWVFIGANARIGANAELSGCVVWENGNVPANMVLAKAIIPDAALPAVPPEA